MSEIEQKLDYEVAALPLDALIQRNLESITPFLKNQRTVVYLDDHGDGTNFLNNNFVQNNYSITIGKESLTTNKTLNSKAVPYMAIIGEEKKQFFKSYNYLKGTLIGDAITKTYYLEGGKTAEVRLRFLNGDNKAIWAILGNKNGGNKRCWGCAAPFDTTNIAKNFLIHEFLKFKKKGLKENWDFFFDAVKNKWENKKIKKQAEDIGLLSSPFFAEALYHSFISQSKTPEQFSQALEGIIVGVDNLHNIRGWILNLISCLKETKRLNEQKYHSLLKEYGLSSSDCSGGKLRLLILNFEKIIIPSLVYEKGNQAPITNTLRKVLSIFQTIVWIAYSPEEAQEYTGIKLLLRYKCLELSLALQKLPGDLKLMDLYLHVILSHFPDFFDEYSFFISSTEPLEGLFVTTKKCKHATSRHKRNILKTVIKRFEHKNQKCFISNDPGVYLESISRNGDKYKDNKYSSYRDVLKEFKDVWIDVPTNNSLESRQVKCFVDCVLNKEIYKKNIIVEEGRVCLKIRDDILEFLSKYDY